jgi:hypothetical protein
MIQRLRRLLRNSKVLRLFINNYLIPTGLLDKVILKTAISPSWESRIQTVVSSPDNRKIARVPEAGLVKHGKQTMHNGIQIFLGSYYGPEIAQLLLRNKGVHEPQEEYVFGEVLKHIPAQGVMVEMGAFWSFYSMWFHAVVNHAKNYMIEPDPFNLEQGKRNFRLNKMKGTFLNAFIGRSNSHTDVVPSLSVVGIVEKYSIPFIDILHSDIQGFEYEMLQGAEPLLSANKIGYIFISTHSNEIHSNCIKFLEGFSVDVLLSINLDESYSEDGLIVARSKTYKGLKDLAVSRK